MTREGTLRHPSYLGLREDKKPEAVVLETEEDVETATAPASIPISNRDRVTYPEAGLTKGELADYYAAVAPIIPPCAGSPPISLLRCTQGRPRQCFFPTHDPRRLVHAAHHSPIEEKDGARSAELRVGDSRVSPL